MADSYMCIGGPLDGEFIAAEAPYFNIMVRTDVDTLSLDPTEELPHTVAAEQVTYRAEPFRIGDTVWTLYIDSRLDAKEAFGMLVGGYRRGDKK